MVEYIKLNKEYSKGLTVKFLKELADDSRGILQEEDLFLLNLDVIGIQINRITYNHCINDKRNFNEFLIYLDFFDQKFGTCQEAYLFIDFVDNKVVDMHISTEEKLDEEFKVVLPLLEKCLVNQLYILKRVIEETEEN
jgi:hypothetical protein